MKNIECLYPNTLKEHRLNAGLTQKQVAKLLGMRCEDRLSHWERGQAMPSVRNLMKLAKLFDVHPEKLYPGLSGDIKLNLESKAMLLQ